MDHRANRLSGTATSIIAQAETFGRSFFVHKRSSRQMSYVWSSVRNLRVSTTWEGSRMGPDRGGSGRLSQEVSSLWWWWCIGDLVSSTHTIFCFCFLCSCSCCFCFLSFFWCLGTSMFLRQATQQIVSNEKPRRSFRFAIYLELDLITMRRGLNCRHLGSALPSKTCLLSLYLA